MKIREIIVTAVFHCGANEISNILKEDSAISLKELSLCRRSVQLIHCEFCDI